MSGLPPAGQNMHIPVAFGAMLHVHGIVNRALHLHGTVFIHPTGVLGGPTGWPAVASMHHIHPSSTISWQPGGRITMNVTFHTHYTLSPVHEIHGNVFVETGGNLTIAGRTGTVTVFDGAIARLDAPGRIDGATFNNAVILNGRDGANGNATFVIHGGTIASRGTSAASAAMSLVNMLTPNTRFYMVDGEIQGSQWAQASLANGNNIVMGEGSNLLLIGGEIHSAPNRGIYNVGNGANIEIQGGTIRDNGHADIPGGGGVRISGTGTTFTMTGGTIEGNTALHGGGLYATNHANVTIGAAAVFQDNVASYGLVVSDALAAANPQIAPGTVTHGTHAFNNHDINTNVAAPTVVIVYNEPTLLAAIANVTNIDEIRLEAGTHIETSAILTIPAGTNVRISGAGVAQSSITFTGDSLAGSVHGFMILEDWTFVILQDISLRVPENPTAAHVGVNVQSGAVLVLEGTVEGRFFANRNTGPFAVLAASGILVDGGTLAINGIYNGSLTMESGLVNVNSGATIGQTGSSMNGNFSVITLNGGTMNVNAGATIAMGGLVGQAGNIPSNIHLFVGNTATLNVAGTIARSLDLRGTLNLMPSGIFGNANNFPLQFAPGSTVDLQGTIRRPVDIRNNTTIPVDGRIEQRVNVFAGGELTIYGYIWVLWVYAGGTAILQPGGHIDGAANGVLLDTQDDPGGLLGDAVFIMNGGLVNLSASGTGPTINVGSGNTRFYMYDGEVRGPTAITSTLTMGNAVGLGTNAFFKMMGGEIHSASNRGVYNFGSNAEFIMSGGTIRDNGRVGLPNLSPHFYGGGGVLIAGEGSTFTMTGGTIENNTALHGGGFYSNNFANVIIGSAAVFQNNVATYGLVVSNALAAANPQIVPGTVTHGTHAFNNHDINTNRTPTTTPTDITDDFTDPNFLIVVRNVLGIPEPGRIYCINAALVQTLSIPGRFGANAITSLAGLQHFTGLNEFILHANQVASIDLSLLPHLDRLFIANNPLTSINLISQPYLTDLVLSFGQLTTVDVSMLSDLETLNLQNNQLTNVTFGNHPQLRWLALSNNQFSTLPNMAGLVALEELHINHNTGLAASGIDGLSFASLHTLHANDIGLMSANLAGLPALEILNIQNNAFTSFAPSANPILRTLNISNQWWTHGPNHTSLDLSANVALESLTASDLGITALDLSNNINLVTVSIGNRYMASVTFPPSPQYLTTVSANGHTAGNGLTSFTITNAPALTTVTVNTQGNLANINLSNNPSLVTLNAMGANLGSTDNINLTGSNAITTLNMGNSMITNFDSTTMPSSVTHLSLASTPVSNVLTAIDVSNFPNLYFLNIHFGSVTTLDLSNNTMLVDLVASENQLTGHLDLTNNTELRRALLTNNQLTSVNVTGTNLGGLPNPGGGFLPVQLNVSFNYMTDLSDVIGWDTLPLAVGWNFVFLPQNNFSPPPTAPNIITTSVDDAIIGQPYSFTFRSDSLVGVTWTIPNWEHGTILNVLTLVPNTGILHGIPLLTSEGTWGFTIRAALTSNPALYTEQNFTITVREAAAIDEITIDGVSDLLPGEHHDFVAVDGDDDPIPNADITWSITGNDDPATTINASGRLTIGANETVGNRYITVRAELSGNASIYDEMQVRIDRNITAAFSPQFITRVRTTAGLPAGADVYFSNVHLITEMDLSPTGMPVGAITNYNGLQYFRSLEELNIRNHGGGVDISVLPNLRIFHANGGLNAAMGLHWVIIDNPLLEEIIIQSPHANLGQTATFNVTDAPNLQRLALQLALGVHTLDLTQNPLLEELNLEVMSNLNVVNTSQNPLLTMLQLTGNPNRQIDLTNNVNLEWLRFHGEGSTHFDWPMLVNLEWLQLQNLNITSIDLSHFQNLDVLWLEQNPLTSLDISVVPNIRVVNAQWTFVDNVIIGNNPGLEALNLNRVGLRAQLSDHGTLTSAQVAAINFAGAPNLEILNLSANMITGMNLADLPSINELLVISNHMTDVDDVIGWRDRGLRINAGTPPTMEFWPQVMTDPVAPTINDEYFTVLPGGQIVLPTGTVGQAIGTDPLPWTIGGLTHAIELHADGTPLIVWIGTTGSFAPGTSVINAGMQGFFGGIPTTVGTFNFGLRATNMVAWEERSFVMTIIPDGAQQIPQIVVMNFLSAAVPVGESYQFRAVAWDQHDAPIPGGVVYSISGQTSAGTSINPATGVLSVALDESAAQITVTATAVGNSALYATATAYITGYVIESVTVIASNNATTVMQNRQLQFRALVTPATVPDDVIWSVSGHALAAIDANGVLSVRNVPAGTVLTITATSTFNTAISGSVTVTVIPPPPTTVNPGLPPQLPGPLPPQLPPGRFPTSTQSLAQPEH